MDRAWVSFALAAVIVAIIPLASILYEVTSKGIGAMGIDFFAKVPPPAFSPCLPSTPPQYCLPEVAGGLGNAVVGTLMLVALATAAGLPIGIFAGVYVSEYGNNWFGSSVQFLGDVLVGNPSVVIGILGYILFVEPFLGYSLVAGSFALAVMMVPIVSNTTSEALKLVPNSLREASMALGVRRWRTTLLMLSNAKAGVATASLLAVARVMGETAPLLFTAGINNQWWVPAQGLMRQPVPYLTFFIYYFATQPYANWQSLAWGAAFILLVIIMGINIVVRILTRSGRAHA